MQCESFETFRPSSIMIVVLKSTCSELILTPPATPEPVLIDEGMVSNMLNEYKSHFPTDTSESRKKS